jgi:hypothetical protein
MGSRAPWASLSFNIRSARHAAADRDDQIDETVKMNARRVAGSA